MNDDDFAYEGSGSDEQSVVRAYLRRLGSLPRLTFEEEIFHARQFGQARADLGDLLAHVPWVVADHVAACRANEVVLARGEVEAEPDAVSLLEEKRRRLAGLLDALRQLAGRMEQMAPVAQETDAEGPRQLVIQSIQRLLSQFHFSAKFYQDSVEDVLQAQQRLAAIDARAGGKMESQDLSLGVALRHRLGMDAASYAALSTELQAAGQRLEAARHALLEGNLRLVISVAKKYSHCGMPFLDLVQEGNLGLMMAVDRFDPQLGHRFSTYAVWWVRQTITQALSAHSRTIRIPANMARSLSLINRTEETLLQELGHEPQPEDIATRLDMPVERIRALRKMERQTISLQSSVDDDDNLKISDLIADEHSPPPDEIVSSRMLSETINQVLSTLTDRERQIVICRFGLMNKKALTLEELSTRFNVTHERIRQIEAAALKKLRHPTRRKFFDGYI